MLEANRAAVKAALKALAAVLAVVESHYFRVEVAYEISARGNSAQALLYALREAFEVREARHARITAGQSTAADLAAVMDRRPL